MRNVPIRLALLLLGLFFAGERTQAHASIQLSLLPESSLAHVHVGQTVTIDLILTETSGLSKVTGLTSVIDFNKSIFSATAPSPGALTTLGMLLGGKVH